ncbi:unnamed protein product [Didymodactylos carnosus]|uniref:C2 domain-containing protein n=1 Tax=Didymodactylos carnosus TaxID=1234261 RepID=A0A8S2N9N0_9BILA|nr:unnamed protein product [Didymodactylos carnosus]
MCRRLSDPYCRLSVIDHDPSQPISSLAPSDSVLSANHPKRSSSLTRQKRMRWKSQKKSSTSNLNSYETEIRPQTVEPEWNEQFEFEIENVTNQVLVISVLDSDSKGTGVRNVLVEKRGVRQQFKDLCDYIKTGTISNGFLGEVRLDIKSLASFDGEKWFQLTGPSEYRGNNRGEVLLVLKIHFKLELNSIQQTSMNTDTTGITQWDRNVEDRAFEIAGAFLKSRLYECALRAACSPLRVHENGPTSFRLAEHVRKLFDVNINEHREKYEKETPVKPYILIVQVKKAKNLIGKAANGMYSDI